MWWEFPLSSFRIKDDAVKVLHSLCQQIQKTQQWLQDWKRSVFSFQSQIKAMPKNAQTITQLPSFHMLARLCSKILQARLQQYMNWEIPDVHAGFRKGKGTRDQIANLCWIVGKAKEFQKNIYLWPHDYAKAFDCVTTNDAHLMKHNKLWNILKEMGIPDHLTCLLRNLYTGQEGTVRTGHGTTENLSGSK